MLVVVNGVEFSYQKLELLFETVAENRKRKLNRLKEKLNDSKKP